MNKDKTKKTTKRVVARMDVDDDNVDEIISKIRGMGVKSQISADRNLKKADEWGEEGVDWVWEGDWGDGPLKNGAWGEEGVDWEWVEEDDDEEDDEEDEEEDAIASRPKAKKSRPVLKLSPQQQTLSQMVDTGKFVNIRGTMYPVAHHVRAPHILYSVRDDGYIKILSIAQLRQL